MTTPPPTPAATVAPADVRPLRIAHLYPSLLNVAGDGGNVTAVVRRAAWRGYATAVTDVGLGAADGLADADLVFFHGGQDVEMEVVAADLSAKRDALHDAVAAGAVVFGVCAGLQLLGHRYVPSAGPALDGLGLLDLETRGGPTRFMQHAAVEVDLGGETTTVVGFENHSGVTRLGPGAAAFGTVVAGAGNNGEDGSEGARAGRVLATYLHGPVLPKNPTLADYLLALALERAAGAPVHLAALDDTVERRNHAVALRRAMDGRGQVSVLAPARLARDLGGGGR